MSVKLKMSVVKDWDLRRVNLDLHREINLAANVIKRDIQEHIADERRIDNEQKQAPLSPLTIAAKKRKSGKAITRVFEQFKEKGTASFRKAESKPEFAEKILRDTGNLWKNQDIKDATPADQRAIITIGPERAEIAEYLQEGTENMPARPFFGISTKGEEGAMLIVDKAIDRALAKV